MDEAESGARDVQRPKSPKSTAGFPESGPESFTQVFAALKKNEGNPGPKQEQESARDDGGSEVANSSKSLDSGHHVEGKIAPPSGNVEQERRSGFPEPLFRYRANDSLYSGAPDRNGDGEFTQLLRRVSGRSPIENTSSPLLTPRVDSRVSTPSEFTEIVSKSMLRENGRQGRGKEVPVQHELSRAPQSESHASQDGSIPVNSSSDPSEAVERTPPKQHNERVSTPPVDPHALLLKVRNSSRMAGGARPLDSRAADSVSSPTSMPPSLAGSPLRSNTTGPSRFQEYVPFLLIANLFLTVLLLLLVSFAFLNH